MAYANVTIGSQTGTYTVNVSGAGQFYSFSGNVYAQPTVNANGVVTRRATRRWRQAPMFRSSATVSQVTDYNYSAIHLPLSMDNVTVSLMRRCRVLCLLSACPGVSCS